VPRFAILCPWLTAAAFGIGIAAYAVVEPISINGTVSPMPSVATRAGNNIKPANFVGATTCAAASCHGGDVGRIGGEYATWAGHNPDKNQARDPHSRAFRVLFNEKSEQIARNLAATQSGQEIPAHEHSLCLKCHAQPERFHQQPTAIASANILDRNVGCESCHGPAEHYLSTHYLPEHLGKSPARKAADIGLYPTKDVAFRTQLCASCHVGDGSREVNHDLIAAGHPRLNFEYAQFHHKDNYQKHWKETAPNFTANAWAIGQVATLRSSIELLRQRAELATANKAPWPEFAEYSCYACHRDLGPDRASWKLINESKRVSGALPWGTWTLPALHAIDQQLPLKELDALQFLMESPDPAQPEVIVACDRILPILDAWLGRQSAGEPASVNKTMLALVDRTLTPAGDKFNNLGWDGAKQVGLGLEALSQSADPRDAQLDSMIVKLKALLQLPKEFDSPRDEKPAAILQIMQDIQKHLRARESGR